MNQPAPFSLDPAVVDYAQRRPGEGRATEVPGGEERLGGSHADETLGGDALAAGREVRQAVEKWVAEGMPAGSHLVETSRDAVRSAEGGALEINQAFARAVNMASGNQAYEAFKAREPEIEGLRNQGNWVVVSAIFSEPRYPNIGFVKDPRDLRSFEGLVVRSGSTREEAVHPPYAFEQSRANPQPPREMPAYRRLHAYEAVLPPHPREK